MVFSSTIFLDLFLPLVLVGYFLINRCLRNIFLLVVSWLFYAWGEPSAIWILIGQSLLFYILGIVLERSHKLWCRKLWVGIGCVVATGGLIYFKYLKFLLDQVTQIVAFEYSFAESIALPIGISFYTFQLMSYLIDVYRQEVRAEKNVINLMLSVAFFPQLIAGPIVRYSTIAHDLVHRQNTWNDFCSGMQRFAIGLARKVLLADQLALIADAVFAQPPAAVAVPVAWVGIAAYSLQIYFDFSGYSDMAIGIARAFGFQLQENFVFPYSACSVREFWRRWHISLSSWLRDYLYIPLGGSRCGMVRTCLNSMVVFLICGLWHGAAWTFVLWGLWHGSALLIERLLGDRVMKRIPRVLGNLMVWLFVMLGWVLFRAPDVSYAWKYVKNMFGMIDSCRFFESTLTMEIISLSNVLVLLLGILLAYPYMKEHCYDKLKNRTAGWIWTTLCWAAAWIFASSSSYNPFIYFRF